MSFDIYTLKEPETVRAIQFLPEKNLKDVLEFLKQYEKCITFDGSEWYLGSNTEDYIRDNIEYGDWIVIGENRNSYVISDELFKIFKEFYTKIVGEDMNG